jgi:hypothetical protein
VEDPAATGDRAVLDRTLARIEASADSFDARLDEVPALAGTELGGLRRFLNAEHLARARRLGVAQPLDAARVEELQAAGELVELEPRTRWWTVRELDYSQPLVTADTRALLEELGRGFHARLDTLGLPPFRFEITSVLRTAADQRALRRVNANATGGPSAHQFGTTLDVAYNAFSPPDQPWLDLDHLESDALREQVAAMAQATARQVAEGRGLELQALLGRTLADLQREGAVLVTRERGQPVFHFTVGTPLAAEGDAATRRAEQR